MLKYTVRNNARIVFTCEGDVKVVKIKMLSIKPSECKWQISGARGELPASSYHDLAFSLVVGGEPVVMNGKDRFRDIVFEFNMSKKVRLKIENNFVMKGN